VSAHFTGESDEEGKIQLDKEKVSNVFVYNAKTFEKINPINVDLEKGVIVISDSYLDVDIDYQYEYTNEVCTMSVG
jgi:hypothetical protein